MPIRTLDPDGTTEPRRSRRTIPLVLLGALLVIYVPTVATDFVATDVNANTLTAWQIARTGTPWMEDVDLPEPVGVVFFGPGSSGHTVTFRTPGQIWAAVPFYRLAEFGVQDFSFTPGNIAAAVMTALAMTLLFGSLRRRTGDLTAAVAVVILALTTPIWSVSADALWTHPVSVLGLAGAAWAAERDRWWLTGLFLGVGILARLHVALIAAVVGLGVSIVRRDLRPTIAVALPSLGAVAVLSIWSRLVFGVWDPRGGYSQDYLSIVPGQGGRPFAENLFGFLLAWDRGWLIWTPLLVLLLPAVVRGWSRAPDWTRVLAVAGLAYIAAQVGLNWYDGGSAFWGYRLALEPLVCVFPLYVTTYAQAGPLVRALVPWITAAQFAMITLGAISPPFSVMNLTNEHWEPNSVYLAVRDLTETAVPLLSVSSVLWLATWYGTRLFVRRYRAEAERS